MSSRSIIVNARRSDALSNFSHTQSLFGAQVKPPGTAGDVRQRVFTVCARYHKQQRHSSMQNSVCYRCTYRRHLSRDRSQGGGNTVVTVMTQTTATTATTHESFALSWQLLSLLSLSMQDHLWSRITALTRPCSVSIH